MEQSGCEKSLKNRFQQFSFVQRSVFKTHEMFIQSPRYLSYHNRESIFILNLALFLERNNSLFGEFYCS